MGILSAVVLLGILIFIHELGHFLVAKAAGVYVERFSIGFGPVIFSKQGKETEYVLSALPLGGYVKMYGEQPDENIPEEKENRSFAHKSLGWRTGIVFAGPFANFLLAVFIYSIIFMSGTPRFLSTIGGVQKDMPAQEAGLKAGDRIVTIDCKDFKYWDEMSNYVATSGGKKLSVTVDRNGEKIKVFLTPKVVTGKNLFGEDKKYVRIGVIRGNDYITQKYNPFSAVKMGVVQTYDMSVLIVQGVVKIFQKVVPADQIGGPIMIFKMAKDSANSGFLAFFGFMALISIHLAILNLLPIPVLDGGHLFFYLIEAIIRRPVSVKIRERAQMVGLALILSLTFFAFYNDIMRFFLKN